MRRLAGKGAENNQAPDQALAGTLRHDGPPSAIAVSILWQTGWLDELVKRIAAHFPIGRFALEVLHMRGYPNPFGRRLLGPPQDTLSSAWPSSGEDDGHESVGEA